MLIAALSSVPAAPTALLPDASAVVDVGHGGGDLRRLLSLRCPGADDGCRSRELNDAMRRLQSLEPLTGELDEALASALRHRSAAPPVGASALFAPSGEAELPARSGERGAMWKKAYNTSDWRKAWGAAHVPKTGVRMQETSSKSDPPSSLSPELMCRCNMTTWGAASGLIFTASADGTRGDPNPCPGATDGSLVNEEELMYGAYGLGQQQPGEPYCTEGTSMADLCNPCGIAKEPSAISAVFTSRFHMNKDGNGKACETATADNLVVTMSVQYRNTQWVWLDVPTDASSGNTITEASKGSDTTPASWVVTVKKGIFPSTWLLGDQSYDLSPDTPYRIMIGHVTPTCESYGYTTGSSSSSSSSSRSTALVQPDDAPDSLEPPELEPQEPPTPTFLTPNPPPSPPEPPAPPGVPWYDNEEGCSRQGSCTEEEKEKARDEAMKREQQEGKRLQRQQQQAAAPAPQEDEVLGSELGSGSGSGSGSGIF